MTVLASVLASASGLDWTICGCLGVLTTSVWTFRVATRRFGWGPRDT